MVHKVYNKRMSKLLLSVSFLVFLLAPNISASNIQFDYLVTGSLSKYYWDQPGIPVTEHTIIGIIGIKQKEIYHDISDYIAFYNEIPYYSFWIEDFGLFTGSGSLNSDWYGYSPNQDSSFTCEFDEFYLTGDLHCQITNGGVVFSDENGIAFRDHGLPTDFYSLPSEITVENSPGFDGFFINSLNFKRIVAVPETNTTILFVFSIIVLAAFIFFCRNQANNSRMKDIG
jgi:hypothetical protein